MDNDLKSIIESYFQKSSYKIIDLIIRGEKGTRVVDIFVDNNEGTNIDELAKINKDLNEIIDNKLVIKDISKLVVSSPGIDRPFKFIWQLNKHIGRILNVELNDGERIEGKLTKISEEDGEENLALEVFIKVKGKSGNSELKEINFQNIKESRVKISFSK